MHKYEKEAKEKVSSVIQIATASWPALAAYIFKMLLLSGERVICICLGHG
jgi:hypothetical protein